MSDKPLVLVIDQGTTTTNAFLFDQTGRPVGRSGTELPQVFPKPGWVEHDPDQIWKDVVSCLKKVTFETGVRASRIAAIGITNQRETAVIWDVKTGKPIHNAIVWQDRRTSEKCRQLKADGLESMVAEKTGLLLDPYFSATKIAWMLDQVPGARERAEKGELAFGTIDCFLLWRLTGGKVHATDVTNASRTMLFNLKTLSWDEELLKTFNVPAAILPEVKANGADYGQTTSDILGGSVAIRGLIGDQQSAAFGQAAVNPGLAKSTYGTGCFIILNTGEKILRSNHRMLTTVAYQMKGVTNYALEGSIFIAGAAVQWLRDGLKIIQNSSETEALARSVKDTGGVYLVPAFAGLGAPYWDADARGAILGLTRDSTHAHIVRATLESVCYQTRDLVEAMQKDGADLKTLRVDGGMVVNNWLLDRLADILGIRVDRPVVTETTALGAAYVAGLEAGVFESIDKLGGLWMCERSFDPNLSTPMRDEMYQGWLEAVGRVRSA